MILITGAAGYIGSITSYHFLKNNYKVIGIDNISTGNARALEVLNKFDNFKFHEGNFGNLELIEQIVTNNKIDCVVHFAANTSVFESTQNPLKYHDNNVSNMINLLKICEKYDINNFIFSSSAATYGEPKTNELITEDTPKNPINPYGLTKLIGEYILNDLSNAKKEFNFIALRYFNVAGASLIAPLGQFSKSSLLIKIAAECAANKRDKMYLYGNDYNTPDGTCVRDYIHVDDLAIAHIEALKYLKNQKTSQAFNVGYSKGTSVKEVIDIMKKISGNDFKVEMADRRTGDPSSLVASNKKITSLTDWKYSNDNLELICKSAYEWELKI